jgi:hypothetical protein
LRARRHRRAHSSVQVDIDYVFENVIPILVLRPRDAGTVDEDIKAIKAGNKASCGCVIPQVHLSERNAGIPLLRPLVRELPRRASRRDDLRAEIAEAARDLETDAA